MEQKDIKTILNKYKAGTASEEEIALLESWYLNFSQGPEILSEKDRLQAFNKVWANLENGQVVKNTRSLWPRIAAAASILLFLSFGGYFLLHKQSPRRIAQTHNQNILPGGNKAILTLANGQQIVLTDAKNGALTKQGKTAVNKTADGKLAYAATSSKSTDGIVYNTMTTPRGGRYELTLSDGSKVTLDAASSVRYPVAFTGNERRVEITGQAYFEVVHNAAEPFKVSVKGQTIEDLGTHFNINAYDDEPVIKTTLLEGRIKVSAGKINKIIKPGQQAILANNQLRIVPVDVEEETAWKNGNFQFENADVKTVMRELARWYDADIKYEGNFNDVHYSGLIPRSSNISAVLRMLKETGNTNFKLEGKTVTVSK